MSDISKMNKVYKEMYMYVGRTMRNKPEYFNCRVYEDNTDVPEVAVPIIIMDLEETSQQVYGSTLDHKENKIYFSIVVDIYAQNIGSNHRRDMAEELREFIYNYLVHERGLLPTGNYRIPMPDVKKYRVMSRFTGVYDIEQDKIFKQ